MKRMWVFIMLHLAGINCLAGGTNTEEKKTVYHQIFTFKLKLDKNLVENITQILKNFTSNTFSVNGSAFNISNLEKSTVCASRDCSCEQGFMWSDEVCQSNSECCNNHKCSFKTNSTQSCISNKTVTVTGSVTIKNGNTQCLAEETTDGYKSCHRNVTETLRYLFSTLAGFRYINVFKYSLGSIVAHFKVELAFGSDVEKMITESEGKLQNLGYSFDLQIEGVVRMSLPTNPVKYNSKHFITCSGLNLNIVPDWKLRQHGQLKEITNGTESTITGSDLSQLFLCNITELWAGEIFCIYQSKKGFLLINYTASGVLDVSLLPIIYITTVPQFPHCETPRGELLIKGECIVEENTENYNVTWKGDSVIIRGRENKIVSPPNSLVYQSDAVLRCDQSKSAKMTCIFENRRGQKKNATVDINVILGSEPYCKKEGDWGKTKSGFTAKLRCNNAEGEKKRKCRSNSEWDQEESECINLEVNSMHKKATIVDIGIGKLEDNTAQVLRRLSNISNETSTLKELTNMKVSVDVLQILSHKVTEIKNKSTVDSFMKSTSNLMETNYEEIWEADKNTENSSMAETYLGSFEKLINASHISAGILTPNVEVAICNITQHRKCSNVALEVNVSLLSTEEGQVKTTGFRHLEKYLHDGNEKFLPNSIVVSTIFEGQKSSSVEVNIDFKMIQPRNSNVEVRCVWWDHANRQWSTQGCKWEGPSHVERCSCTHLSSFAMLMSREPLKVPWLSQVTLAGLSVSVISLVITLLVELAVWALVVKSSTLYLRHIAQINICLCLLIANCCFLASLNPHEISQTLCMILVMLKHFCYLAMFFWMLCLSTTLIHQAVFLFHEVSKGTYLKFSLILGYVCPFLIVFITVLSNNMAEEGVYFSKNTCWLVYKGLFQGSLFTFILPVGVIVFINVFSMLVVIVKLLYSPISTGGSNEKNNAAFKTIMRSVVLLTPIFGTTWILGFGVTSLDLTVGVVAYVVNYAFVILNAFQGLFIFLTTCLGDKMVREALLKQLKLQKPESSKVFSSSTEKK